MAIVVGNVVTDPTAQSFISVADANAYLAPEGIAAWESLTTQQREGALVKSSRWIAYSYTWCNAAGWGPKELELLGIAAARLAAETAKLNLWKSSDERGPLSMAKAGTVQVQWRGLDKTTASAGGKWWPWLETLLEDLICDPRDGIGVMVV